MEDEVTTAAEPLDEVFTPEVMDDLSLDDLMEEPEPVETPADTETDPYVKYGVDLSEIPEEARPAIEKKLKGVDQLVSKWGDEVRQEREILAAKKEKLDWYEGVESLVYTDPQKARGVLLDIVNQIDQQMSQRMPAATTPGNVPTEVNWEFESDGVKALAYMIAQLAPRVDDAASHAGAQRVNAEVARLQAEFPTLDVNALITEARANPNVPLRYIAVNQQMPNIEKAVTKKVYENLQKKKQTAPLPSAAASQPAPVPGKKMTIEEAAQMAMKTHHASSMKG